METTYRVTVMHLLRVAPVRKQTYEGVRYMDEAIKLGHEHANLDPDDNKARTAELAIHGRTEWGYGFTDVTIEREAQAAPQEDATTWSNTCKGACKWESDPQPHNQYQSKCPACGNTMPF